jgi:hypothetical protein
MLWLLRLQIGVVYFYGGIGKLNPDWLFHAQPLRTWLLRAVDTPLIGPILGMRETAFLMSWGGAVFDLTIPFLLSNRRARLDQATEARARDTE